jgi:predicted RND superfamily exporter protein
MQTSDTVRWRTLARSALFAIIGVTLFMGWRVSQIGFDYDFESFFPQDDPETAFYLDFRDRFETDNDFLIIGIEGHPGIYDQDFLEAKYSVLPALKNL